jgi:hypothetical protein
MEAGQKVLAASLPAAAAETADLLRNDASQPTRLGFPAFSYAAVDYALTGGGQIVDLCREAIKAGAHPSHSLRVFTDEFLDAGGTVYAFDLSGFDVDALTFEGIFKIGGRLEDDNRQIGSIQHSARY